MIGALGRVSRPARRLVTYDAVRPGPTPFRFGHTLCAVHGSGPIEERQ